MFAKKLSFTLASIAAVALSAFALTAFAQTDTPAQPFANSPKYPLPAEAQVRIINLASNTANRIEGAISRFDNIIARSESRITKMQQEGYPVEDARAYLDEAKSQLERARLQIVDIDKRIADAVAAQDYWVAWFPLRDSFSEAKALLTSVKGNLQNMVSELYLTRNEGIPPVADDASQTISQ